MAADQERVGDLETLVAPLVGDESAGALGALAVVVNDHVDEVVLPPVFFATTRQ